MSYGSGTQRVHYIGRRVIAAYNHHYWALHLPSPVLVPSSSLASSEVTVAPPCVLATSSSSELWRQNVNICVLYPIMNGRVVTVVTMPPWKLWIYTSMVEIRQLGGDGGGGGNTSNEVCRLIAGLLHLPPPARCWCNVRILFCNVQIFCWDPDTPDKPHASRPVDFPWWSWNKFSYKLQKYFSLHFISEERRKLTGFPITWPQFLLFICDRISSFNTVDN